MEAEQITQQVEQVRRNIEQWRQTRTKLGAMSPELWQDAAAVARVAGTHRVARALGLNYLVLKQRAFPKARFDANRPPRAIRSSKPRAATFVEVKPPPSTSAPAAAVVIEVVATSGARLTLRLDGGGVSPELASLVASFR